MVDLEPGMFVFRKSNSCEEGKGFDFECHPVSFGQVIRADFCEGRDRPEVADPEDRWIEVVVKPFSNKMSPDGLWLYWDRKEIFAIPAWGYCLLGLLWPLLRLMYKKPLEGQSTNYG